MVMVVLPFVVPKPPKYHLHEGMEVPALFTVSKFQDIDLDLIDILNSLIDMKCLCKPNVTGQTRYKLRGAHPDCCGQ